MVETKIRKGTFQHIENELYDYFETRKAIIRIRSDLLHASPSHDVTGIRGNLPGDPTGRTASLIASHKQLNEMEKVVEAIDAVVERLPDDKKKMIQLRYWARPQTLTWDGIALELNTGRATVFRWRDEIIEAIAIKLGWR